MYASPHPSLPSTVPQIRRSNNTQHVMEKHETTTITEKDVDGGDESEKTPVGDDARMKNDDDKKVVRRLDHISVVLGEIRRRSYDPVQRECPTCHARNKTNSSWSDERCRDAGRGGGCPFLGWCLGCISSCCKVTIVTVAFVFIAMLLLAYLYRDSRGIGIEDARRQVHHQ